MTEHDLNQYQASARQLGFLNKYDTDDLIKEIKKLREEKKVMMEALIFYNTLDQKNYNTVSWRWPAQEALSKVEALK